MSISLKTPIRKIEGKITRVSTIAPRWRWYHGVAGYIIAQGLAFGLSGLVSIASGKGKNAREAFFGDVPYFKSLKQSIVTPPSWAFAPAWTINNISALYGQIRVLNKPAGTPGRDTYLALQGASWLNYVVFNAAYFSLRSPINAVVLTLSFFGLTIASICVAIFRLKDTKVALSLATLLIWLIVASTAAVAQAAWNRDALYKVGPFLEASPSMVKTN